MRDPLRGFSQICRMQNLATNQYLVLFVELSYNEWTLACYLPDLPIFIYTFTYLNFQSESAFKSHNSKLHLERREKTYYCRECDETFTCLVKHSLHIVIHRTWTQEEMGMQCRICGKVFTRVSNDSIKNRFHEK